MALANEPDLLIADELMDQQAQLLKPSKICKERWHGRC